MSCNCHKSGKAAECGASCVFEPDSENNGGRLSKEARDLIYISAAAVLFAAGLLFNETPRTLLFFAAFFVSGAEILFEAVKSLFQRRFFAEGLLMTIATLGAAAIGEYAEAAAIMILYRIGEALSDAAVGRARKSIGALAAMRPSFARVRRGDTLVSVSPEEVGLDERVVIFPGERIPLDGGVVSGESLIDSSALTGESLPLEAFEGTKVKAGWINGRGSLEIRVTAAFSDSELFKMVGMAREAARGKASKEKFITRFARIYTPAVVAAALLIMFIPPLFSGFSDFREWFHRALVFLVASCPCALVISIPLSYFGGMGAAAKRGFLTKGGTVLERLARIDTVAFDKTGTLTTGELTVNRLYPRDGVSKDELLKAAAEAEYFSNHPIARAIKSAFGGTAEQPLSAEERGGFGAVSKTAFGTVAVGSARLMTELGVSHPEPKGATGAFVARNGQFLGEIELSDTPSAGAKESVRQLRALGIKRVVMLTGDTEKAAGITSESLGITEFHAGLLPHEKLLIAKELSVKGGTAFVGDGVNDAPALAGADVGIAMGASGSDAAAETADAVIMNNSLSTLVSAIKVSRATEKTVRFCLLFSLGTKLAVLTLGVLGLAGMWAAVLADVGVTLVAVTVAISLIWRKY